MEHLAGILSRVMSQEACSHLALPMAELLAGRHRLPELNRLLCESFILIFPLYNYLFNYLLLIGLFSSRQQLPESSELKELNSRPQVQQPNWEVFEAQRFVYSC